MESDDDEIIENDPKWGEADFSHMKTECASCGKFIPPNRKRFLNSGDYCGTCSNNCKGNLNRKLIHLKRF